MTSEQSDQAGSAAVPAPRPPTVRGNFAFRHRGLMGVLLLTPVALAVLASRPLIPADSVLTPLLNGAGWVFFLLYVMFHTISKNRTCF